MGTCDNEILELACSGCGNRTRGTFRDLFGSTKSLMGLPQLVCKQCEGMISIEFTGEFNADDDCLVTVKYRFFDYKRSLELGRGKRVAGELIKYRSDLTHSEFQFSSTYNLLSFSSTIEDAFKGCRFKLIRYRNDWWKTVERVITVAQERDIWCNAHNINGKKYDLVGLLSHATPWKIIRGHPDKFWCSENNAFITKPHIYTGDETEVTPDGLYDWLLAHPQAA